MRCSTITLTEILVILTIIAVLLSISIPAIGIGIVDRRHISSASGASVLTLAMFNYSTDNGCYPSGSTSTEAFKTLFPQYLQDPAHLFLVKEGGHKPFTGTSIDKLTRENICWTITMNQREGVTGADPTDLPLLLSDLGSGYPTFPGGETKVTLISSSVWANNNIWGDTGVTIVRLDQSIAFLRPNLYTNQVTLTGAKFKPAEGSAYASIAP